MYRPLIFIQECLDTDQERASEGEEKKRICENFSRRAILKELIHKSPYSHKVAAWEVTQYVCELHSPQSLLTQYVHSSVRQVTFNCSFLLLINQLVLGYIDLNNLCEHKLLLQCKWALLATKQEDNC